MLKLEERIVLKTIDGQVIVRPQATEINSIVEYTNVCLGLDKEGIAIWNSGGYPDWRHGVVWDKKINNLFL